MRTYSRDFVLLHKSYWNFSMVDYKLHCISSCDEQNHIELHNQIHLITQPSVL